MARPYKRVILVLRPVSSRKTSLRTPQLFCALRHLRRDICSSGRPCSAALRVFFIAQLQALQAMPQGRRAELDAEILGEAFLELRQSQIRLLFDPTTQLGVVLF